MTMLPPDLARLRLAQFLSPAFPVGSFAWSQGLEWAMDQRLVTRASLQHWLSDWLEHGTGWTDAVLVGLALQADADHGALDDLARATCMTAQRMTETTEQGAAFTANVSALTGHINPAATLPIALGRACGGFPLPAAEIIGAYVQGQVAALVSAAVRFMPLGPTEGQAMLSRLQPAIIAIAERAAKACEADLASATWGADIAAMHHETMPVRIFRS